MNVLSTQLFHVNDDAVTFWMCSDAQKKKILFSKLRQLVKNKRTCHQATSCYVLCVHSIMSSLCKVEFAFDPHHHEDEFTIILSTFVALTEPL